jgi:Uma2 family endonuclease
LITEVIDGKLYASPQPAQQHAKVASRIGMIIGSAYDLGEGGPGGWWVVDKPELHLDADILVPDLGGWRRDRMPEYPETSGCNIVPDWVCEVLAPTFGRVDRGRKAPAYARKNVEYLWLIDPLGEFIEVKHLKNGRWRDEGFFGGDDIVRAEPFADVEFNASTLWTSPLPSP